jgi:hypothetical protein
MKRIAVLFLLTAGSIFPQTYYLNVWSKGKVTSIAVNDIKKLTFLNVTSTKDVVKEQELIRTFELFQNYPNPFNPSTTIQYQISNPGQVKIQIFNITGELVTTLTNAYQNAGRYTVNWDGKDKANRQAASGIYIYRVMLENSVLSKKMLLLK